MFSAHHGSDLTGALRKSTCRLLIVNCSTWRNEAVCAANGAFIKHPGLKVKQLREYNGFTTHVICCCTEFSDEPVSQAWTRGAAV